jgi:hypothetical protein
MFTRNAAMIPSLLLVLSVTVGCGGSGDDAVVEERKVPVLLYHAWQASQPCDYINNYAVALKADLEMIHQQGFVVVPVEWIVEWRLGQRDLPDNVVGITFDDGLDNEWLDIDDVPCGPLPSVRSILQEFKDLHADDLPSYSPHVTSFVIGSRTAREIIGLSDVYGPWRTMGDFWWNDANASDLMSIMSHGLDHDHIAITQQEYDPILRVYLPVSGYADGVWRGKFEPERINTYASNDLHIRAAGEYIESVTGEWPRLLAHPIGTDHVSDYTMNVYLPSYGAEHQAIAAFCTEAEADEGNFVTLDSNRWCLPRFSWGELYWRTPEDLLDILLISSS